ncbi:MAG: methionine synthase [Chloroflexi bacterium]|nr:methionine synthase [Chloroflexota bacterium]
MDKLLPTSVIGSYSTPSWLWTALEEIKTGRYGETDERETLNDAVTIAINDQEKAGVDIITDGEMRRFFFVQSFYGHMTGLQAQEPLRRTGLYGYDSVQRYLPVERIKVPHGLGIVEEFQYLKANTKRAIKATCPGPLTMTIHIRIKDKSIYRDRVELAAEFADVINAELKALVAAGATYIQLDEPSASIVPGSLQDWVDLMNRALDGVQARRCLHVCFGNLSSRPRGKREYAWMFPMLGEVKVDEFSLEFANREMTELDIVREFAGERDFSAGLVDVKSFWVEPPEEIAARIRRVLEVAPAERLTITPDCGFFPIPRWLASLKLQNMVKGANIVRRELQG